MYRCRECGKSSELRAQQLKNVKYRVKRGREGTEVREIEREIPVCKNCYIEVKLEELPARYE